MLHWASSIYQQRQFAWEIVRVNSECEIYHQPQTDMFWSHSTGLGLKYWHRQARFIYLVLFFYFFIENVEGIPTTGKDAAWWHLKWALKLQMWPDVPLGCSSLGLIISICILLRHLYYLVEDAASQVFLKHRCLTITLVPPRKREKGTAAAHYMVSREEQGKWQFWMNFQHGRVVSGSPKIPGTKSSLPFSTLVASYM